MEDKGLGELAVTERELNILKDLYEYRVLTTEQIREKYFEGTKQAVNYVLNKLRKRKMIRSKILKGSRENKKGYAYHRLTETGMECLARHGVSVEGQVQNLYINTEHVYYVLLANDIIMSLTKAGWKALDSRKVKQKYNLDQGMQIHGMLFDPEGKSYGFYVMLKRILRNNLGKIIAEIKDNYPSIKNFIIFSKGEESYQQFIDFALNPPPKRVNNKYIEQEPIYTGYDLKILPVKIGKKLLMKYPTKSEWITALSKYFGFEIITMGKTESRQSFDTIIRYKGEEMYFVDITDTDLTEIHHINLYNQRNYEWEKRRKILVTSFLEQQRALINSLYVEHLILESKDLKNLLEVFPACE